jgi:hypothetical protein
MKKPKRNPMKKVSWLIVAIAVLSSVIVRIPDISERFRAFTNGTTKLAPVGPQTTNVATSTSDNIAGGLIDNVPTSNDAAGFPEDVADEIKSLTTSGNDSSPRHMEAAVLMMNAEHVGLKSGCKRGVLLLDGSGLHFSCPDNVGKNLEVLLADISGVDKCGIKDRDGHPYHFKIENSDPEQGERIINDWLEQARHSSQ